MDEHTRLFEDNRRVLEGLAYRMLGTLADARDVVQDTYLKWRDARSDEIRSPRAWLVTVCSRLALNTLQSARARRETYVGTWLPEPLLDNHTNDPERQLEIDDTVSVALMLALEKLSPSERAAFLLHEVFGYGFDDVAAILGKRAAACRKLASRARTSMRGERPRFRASPVEHRRLLEAFLSAARTGDLDGLKSLLAEDVEAYADGGGRATASVQVVRGAGAVSALFARIWQDYRTSRVVIRMRARWFNGGPGLLMYENDRLATALSVSVEDGVIRRLYAHRNPEKLTPFLT
jgi:RNA polymerase sigma-70 factor (ECF subfamily)